MSAVFSDRFLNNMKSLILTLWLIILTGSAHAAVYKWIDANGKVHFGDRKPASIKTEKVTLEINTYTSVKIDQSLFDVGPRVVMYSTEWCTYCKKAKRYFKKNNIAFTEYDIEKNSNARRRHKQMGAKGVPVILAGKKRMSGFSEEGFERIYK